MSSDHDERHQGGPMDPDAGGKTAGPNTQSQGGIHHEVAQAGRAAFDPAAGMPGGPLGGRTDPPDDSLDEGGAGRPHDSRAHHGLSGDDGAHEPADSGGTPATLQPGPVADLGAQQEQRLHGVPQDPAERTTGADTPNQGGVAGSPGGPKNAPPRIPGQNIDEGTAGGGQSRNDEQLDQQV
jgi:hypothetical protein